MPAKDFPWYLEQGHGPLVAAALHDGHELRRELADQFALSEAERLREEDPFTGGWTSIAPTRLIALRSRFEVDFNRPRELAVYRSPADAWGLEVWKVPPSTETVQRSLAVYDGFYREVRGLLEAMVRRYRRVVVLDLHTYNHRRRGPTDPPDNETHNPEVNVGTGTMDRKRWAAVVDRFIMEMRDFDYLGRRLDVRENVRFRGGYFPRWTHATFAESVCVIAVEVKKFFMDEWTGRGDERQVAAIQRALKSTIWGLYEELVKLGLDERGIPA